MTFIMEKDVLVIQHVRRERPGFLFGYFEEKGLSFDALDLSKNPEFPDLNQYRSLLVLGGMGSANDETEIRKKELTFIQAWLDTEKPYLGICLGMQLLVKASGGDVVKASRPEMGFRCHFAGDLFLAHLTEEGQKDELFDGVGSVFEVFQMHEETVDLSGDIQLLAQGSHVPHQAVKIGKNAYGVQYHFELTREMFDIWRCEHKGFRQLDENVVEADFEMFSAAHEAMGRKMLDNFFAALRV